MMNPWIDLPTKAPFLLKEDKPYIDAYNSIETNDRKIINTNHVPEARLGPVTAPVVILQLNPSYDKNESNGPKSLTEIENDLKTIKDDKTPHKGGKKETIWWNKRLKELRLELGEEALSKNLLSIEFFPYRSLNFGHSELRIPSQTYTFSLVRDALERNAIVIIGRGRKLWCQAIPELCDTENESIVCLKNPQCSFYSMNNLGDKVFNKVVDRIKMYNVSAQRI